MKKLFENWQKHLNEEAVPHSAHHVVKKMKKTGLSAKEALKSLTTDLSDEEAERWLERHKDEMDSAKKELDEGAELKIPVERYDAFKRKIEQWGMLFNKFADHAQDLGHPEHAKAAAPKLLHKVNKLESELRKIMNEFDLNYKSYADERHAALKKLDQFDGDNEYFLENEGDKQ